MAVVELLILGHLLNRQRRDYEREEDTAEAVGLLVLLLVPTLLILMPYLVYVAVRDYGGGRFWALGWVALVLAGVAAVGVLVGPWWAVAMVLATATGAVGRIAWAARRLRLEEEREMGYTSQKS